MSEKKKIPAGGSALKPPPGAWPNATPIPEGISLRDWFAGMALVGILGARQGFLVDVGTDNATGWAYDVADSMLAARETRTP